MNENDRLVLITAIPLTALGAISFVSLPKDIITKVIGGVLISLAFLKYFNILKFQHAWLVGAIVGTAMISGTYTAKRFINNMNKDKFQKYVAVLLFIVGLYMLVIGG